MSIESRLKAAVTPIVPEFRAARYNGSRENYCTYNATEIPESFGDNEPHSIRYMIQLHWFYPIRFNPNATKRDLRQAILAADFTAPTVEDASDSDGGHLVFEFEGVDGEV